MGIVSERKKSHYLQPVSYTHLDVYKRQVLAMLPMFLLAMYEKNGQPLEVIQKDFLLRLFRQLGKSNRKGAAI